jgi:hypothetical protein
MRYRPPPKDEAARLYHRFTKATGVDPQPGESPLRYAGRLAEQRTGIGDVAGNITQLYLDTRYGPPGSASVQRLRAAVTQFAEGVGA